MHHYRRHLSAAYCLSLPHNQPANHRGYVPLGLSLLSEVNRQMYLVSMVDHSLNCDHHCSTATPEHTTHATRRLTLIDQLVVHTQYHNYQLQIQIHIHSYHQCLTIILLSELLTIITGASCIIIQLPLDTSTPPCNQFLVPWTPLYIPA